MYSDVPFWLSLVMLVAGFAALAWSSDTFVDGASSVAKALGISPFVIGMVIIGFGTSAPELCVSVMSGLSDHSNLSLGNAYGSCVFNIAAILGIAAMIRPLAVKPMTAFVAGPALAAISLGSMFVLRDGVGSRGFKLWAHIPSRHPISDRKVCVYVGETIGRKRIIRIPPMRAPKFTLEITKTDGDCVITDVEVYG